MSDVQDLSNTKLGRAVSALAALADKDDMLIRLDYAAGLEEMSCAVPVASILHEVVNRLNATELEELRRRHQAKEGRQ